MSDDEDFHAAWWEAEELLVVCRNDLDRTSEVLAALSFAAGRYIECDERPRTPELWTSFCEAQQQAAVFLNTGRMP